MKQHKTANEIQLELGRKLKDLRLTQNVTQQDITRRTGVAQTSIQRLEATGKGSVHTLVQVLRVLGHDCSEFIPAAAVMAVTPMELLENASAAPRQRARPRQSV